LIRDVVIAASAEKLLVQGSRVRRGYLKQAAVGIDKAEKDDIAGVAVVEAHANNLEKEAA